MLERDDFEPTVEIGWSDEDGCWVATDRAFPGLSAKSDSYAGAYRELKIARDQLGDGSDLPGPPPGPAAR